jgi:hypothetical protein
MRKVRPDIKPCPYTTCGNQAVLTGDEGIEEGEFFYQVECEGCCASGPSCDDPDAAVQAWNEIDRRGPKYKAERDDEIPCLRTGCQYFNTTFVMNCDRALNGRGQDLPYALICVDYLPSHFAVKEQP